MDRELVALVGAGLQVTASGLTSPPPVGSIRDGYAFIEHLMMFGDSGLKIVVIDTVTTLWGDWLRSGLPRAVAEEHIKVLPDILEEYRIEPSAVLASMAAMGVSERTGCVAAHRLAAIIIDKASADGIFTDTGINRQLAFFFVERLLELLLTKRVLIKDLETPMRTYYEHFQPSENGSETIAASGPFNDDRAYARPSDEPTGRRTDIAAAH
ncbi:MAG: hypothetical protein ACKVP7_23785 [Hyphomicrobiaceae bacterium]